MRCVPLRELLSLLRADFVLDAFDFGVEDPGHKSISGKKPVKGVCNKITRAVYYSYGELYQFLTLRIDDILKALQSYPLWQSMTSDEQQFFKALGTRIAQLRREQGLSQQAFADQLGIAQQTFAHYEVGRARMPVSLLPELAKFFGVRVDDLLGLRNGAGKRGPAPKFQQQIELLGQLPKTKQKVVMEMLEGVLSQASR